jgi:cyclopropane fatty-acyl-phospholipid synthase-like methyltransferase
MFFSPEEHVNLLHKAYNALAPGGTLVLSQYIADDARRKRKSALRNALWIYASSAQGDAYTTSQCKGFVERAGFVNVIEKEFILDEEEAALILGTKP